MKAYKTPLRYPGGKSRAVQKSFAYIREDKTYTEFREPFLGGGSFAISGQRGIQILLFGSVIFMNLLSISGSMFKLMAKDLEMNLYS